MRCKTRRDDTEGFRSASDSSGAEEISAGGAQAVTEFEDRKAVPLEWPKTIAHVLQFFPCCPPDAFTNIKQFYDNLLVNHIPDNHKLINVAIRNWSAKLRQWRIIDFVNYYNDVRVKPYFNAYARPIDNYYFDVEMSVDIANQLLLYQFDNEVVLIQKFLTDLYNILDFVIPKFNSMCIESPPSAGKNFFFRCRRRFFSQLRNVRDGKQNE